MPKNPSFFLFPSFSPFLPTNSFLFPVFFHFFPFWFFFPPFLFGLFSYPPIEIVIDRMSKEETSSPFPFCHMPFPCISFLFLYFFLLIFSFSFLFLSLFEAYLTGFVFSLFGAYLTILSKEAISSPFPSSHLCGA